MAYAASLAEAKKILDAGIAAQPSAGAALLNGGSIFHYCSSHASADIDGTGFFTGCGAQPLSSTGEPTYDTLARSTNNVGMRPGDLLCNVESSGGASPGRVTWHAVIGSTFASGGYDCTVSAEPTT